MSIYREWRNTIRKLPLPPTAIERIEFYAGGYPYSPLTVSCYCYLLFFCRFYSEVTLKILNNALLNSFKGHWEQSGIFNY